MWLDPPVFSFHCNGKRVLSTWQMTDSWIKNLKQHSCPAPRWMYLIAKPYFSHGNFAFTSKGEEQMQIFFFHYPLATIFGYFRIVAHAHTFSDAGFAGVRASIDFSGKFAELRVRRCSNSLFFRIKSLSPRLTRAPQRGTKLLQIVLKVPFHFVSVFVPLFFQPCGNRRVAARSSFQS